MTTIGWIFLAVSWVSILGLNVYCFLKVLSIKDTIIS